MLANVFDNTPPVVTASLTRVVRYSSYAGQFRVGFSATDDADPVPSVSAVMETPAGTDSLPVVFTKAYISEDQILFDLRGGRINLIGKDEGRLRGLLATMRANGGASVTQNQLLVLGRYPGQQFLYVFRNGVLLAESAPTFSLKATGQDAAHNVGVAMATPTFGQ